MKITKVEATALRTRSVIVQVTTDEGLTGIGECTPMNLEVLAHFVNTALSPLLVGEDPLQIDKLWNKMLFGTYKLGPHGVQPGAIAGVDIALWDILGKATNLPIHTLLGRMLPRPHHDVLLHRRRRSSHTRRDGSQSR